MLHPSTKKLIDRLAEMTERGKLKWEEGENDTVVYATEGYSVALTTAPDELIITSKEGKQLERADEAELAEATTETGGSYTEVVANMKREASRVARGTEAAISTLLAGIDLDGDGVPDISVDADDDEAELVETAEPEDIADETSAVSAEEVADLDAEEPEDAVEIATEAEVETSDTDHSLEEPDMTEAVARLADEVNGRDDAETVAATTLTAAAGGLAAAVALAGTGEEAEDRIEDVDVIAAPEAETEIEVEAEAEAVATDAVETVIETDRYVPFGLETAETVSVDAPEEPATEEVETHVTDVAEDVAPIAMATASVADLASSVSEGVEETVSETTESMVEAVTETVSDTTETTAEAMETVTTEVTETVEATTEMISEEAAEAVDNVVAFTADTVESAQETVAETVETITPITASLDDAPAPATEAPRSFSLSGIGAGFGLGALSATTEASGVPGATPAEGATEKVVIDATDDVPLSETVESVVESASAADVTDAAIETIEDAAQEDGDTMLKPRTRFNPWD